MPFMNLAQERCRRDGLCIAVCPLALLEKGQDGLPRAIAEAEELCVRCGHCVAVCPEGCLSLQAMPVELCPPMQSAFRLSEAQCELFFRSRRSIRVYKEKSVPQEELKRLIEIARYAPSGHNTQGARWLVVSGREQLQGLAGLVIDWMRWMTANMPELAQALHMTRTIARWEQGSDVILRGAPALIIAYAPKNDRMAPSTCTLALAYLELAATSMGLGGCWAGYFNAAASSFPPLIEALALPEGHQSYGAMMIGFPQYQYQRLPARKELDITWRLE